MTAARNVYRDLDTIQRFALIIDAKEALIEEIRKLKAVPQCRERPLDGRFLPFQLLDDAGKAVCHSLIPPV